MTPAHRRRTTCRICGGGGLATFLELGPQPLANSYPASEAECAGEPRFPLDVCFCPGCALVQTPDVIDPALLFRDYVYRTGMSAAMDDHFRRYAESVVAAQRLGAGDLVVEVASNDGTLLRHFRDLGVRTLGIEPASNLAAESRAAGIETLDLFFDEAAAATVRDRFGPARTVIANNVLAHVDDPVGFLRGARRLLGDGGRVWIEAPVLDEMVRNLEYDTIYHEHLSYFSAASLARAFGAAGLCIESLEPIPVHGGSLRVRASTTGSGTGGEVVERAIEREREAGLLDLGRFRRFAADVRAHREKLLSLLRRLESEGASIAAYGAPAKGNTLLNWCRIGTDLIDFTVDRNPGKVGRLTPGMHLPILPISALLERRPDYVLVLPWNLFDEIARQQAGWARAGGRFILPIPEPKIVAGGAG